MYLLVNFRGIFREMIFIQMTLCAVEIYQLSAV